MPRELTYASKVRSIHTIHNPRSELEDLRVFIAEQQARTRLFISEETWKSTRELLKVMAEHREVDYRSYEKLLFEMNKIQEQNLELKDQLLITRSKYPEMVIVGFTSIALGFFLFGFLFTPFKSLFLFGIIGDLGLLVPGGLALFLPKKNTNKGS